MRVTLQEELDQLEAGLQEEGEPVLRSLRGAINALSSADSELADEVIAFDDEVDERYDLGFFVGNEVYDHLEKVVDRFDDVANVMHGIMIEHV